MNQQPTSILVVDDEEMIVTILENFLEDREFEVVGLSDSTKALELVRERSFDLVFTDLMMPKVTGMELIKAIRERNDDTQIIIFTGYASVDSAIEAVQQGVYDYIRKPFRLEEIDHIMDHALEQQRLRRENIALQQKITRMLARITMLYDISTIMYQVANHDQAMEMLFDTLAEGMQIRAAFLMGADEQGQYRIQHAQGLPEGFADQFTLRVGAGLNDKPVGEVEPVQIDIESGLTVDDQPIEMGESFQCLYLLPIQFHERLIAFLGALQDKDVDFDPEDELTLLKVLATQIAPLIGEEGMTGGDLPTGEGFHAFLAAIVRQHINAARSLDAEVSFAALRLLNPDEPLSAAAFHTLRKDWFSLVQECVGQGRRLYWVGFDTLLVVADGGNPVGLEHHCADLRQRVEERFCQDRETRRVAMTYAIQSYPFDATSTRVLLESLGSLLFTEAGACLQHSEH